MKFITGTIILLSLFNSSKAQPLNEKAPFSHLCGCFEVDFKYAETFAADPGYQYHERDETGATAELALPVWVSDHKLVIQHLLIVSPNFIVKHWREEWTYENPVLWRYLGDRTWVKEKLDPEKVQGKWTQTVWEVSDEPRYQGISAFVQTGNDLSWQNTTDAPLPRREYSVRNDYNILQRTNRLHLAADGYVHEQDNKKVIRSGGKDRVLVEEKGYNTYKRVEEKECTAAKLYWDQHKVFWTRVREIWDAYLDKTDTLRLRDQVGGKKLHDNLLALANEVANRDFSRDTLDQMIRETIEKFMVFRDKL
ncbi:MAG: hypothetical protein GC171_09355 [Terrimonas sp.]|nr:hypothetical protein [Terrimonas sp.]